MFVIHITTLHGQGVNVSSLQQKNLNFGEFCELTKRKQFQISGVTKQIGCLQERMSFPFGGVDPDSLKSPEMPTFDASKYANLGTADLDALVSEITNKFYDCY